MTTVKDLKEWLNRFPDDTIVNVLKQEPSEVYESYGDTAFEDIILDSSDSGDGWEFIDFADNKFVKEDAPFYGKKYLHLGER